MFSISQIIILVILTFTLFVLGPYLIMRREKTNKNTPNLKKRLITHFALGLFVLLFFTSTMYMDNIMEVKKESKPIPKPQIETQAEYYYKKGDYETKYALTEEDKPFLNTQGKWMLNNVSGEISEPIIERKYTFFGFNGLDKCQYPDKVPKDLAPFIREPFDNWYYTNQMPPYKGHGGSDKDYFISGEFHIDVLNKKEECVFYPKSFVSGENYTIKMNYKGPKYLLEEDKDFYVNEVKCPLQEDKRFEYKSKTYYLHFNPKQQYITLYTEKMNTKEK